jgi:hypothetical protein
MAILAIAFANLSGRPSLRMRNKVSRLRNKSISGNSATEPY